MNKIDRVTPIQAMEILKKAGHQVTYAEAELILDMLYKFANVALENMLYKIRKEDDMQ